ncbi:protein phosphatase 1 regulatory subunit 37 isoform X1 [Zootoca vivipara]|uniref:protein phosphatase 1 regulatory subunit 37 isoform X1 n=1 Tax=Zootoca vivipara TaxID=8524 RepID=UPI00293BD16A|nr:protein phosphatase 1 regulatory subunit 37 isoform X1 [Zootoca vivipara]XP_060131567.1 protein phosphatase 1 regulatory subunit 37 isoform X1 [Zootoca vivipara]XP_060131569.1 protein phosphatase 1 regulatory subunit 37 isoform X1 [Zootoca vivipara]
MRREEGELSLTETYHACLAMECVQVSPMQQQQGKAAEGDHLMLLLPPPAVQKEEEGLLRASDPWAVSRVDGSQGGTKLQEALDFSAHLQNTENLTHSPPTLGSHPGREMVGNSTACSSKEDLKDTEHCDLADEQLQPSGKETLSHPLQEELLGNKVACNNPPLVTAAGECLTVAEKCSQQNNCLQEKLDSSSQNCCLGLEATSGESPEDDQTSHGSLSADDGKLKPGAKHVTFPSDEDIVSGAVEPKDPWRHAQNVTVEEIITAYKQACQKLNCKQIPKLLKQIQEYKDLTPRIECLDLKGEKLDYKACEALEEIFKRLQFKIVDLEQTNLDEDGASALFDMIEYYESATHLNISFNKHIGTRGWQAAAHMMRKTNCLQYLDARNTPLLDHSAPFVARALRISNSLTVLHLENASLSGRPLMLLATALKMNMNLRELYLADNKLNSLQDSAQLGNLLKFNCFIQILDLRNNHILDSGLAYICEGLKEQRKGLVTLVLWNNQLTHTGMAYMGMTLPHTQSLETLNLGHNPIGNEGVRNLKNGLISNRSVLRLGLASTKLTCEGAVAVAEFIAESPRLLRLDLRENEIKTGGLMALSLALKVNHSLLRLDLDREPKKESVKSFIETQKALLTEIQNGCKRNFVLAKEKEEKEQQLQQSASMPEITITEPLEEGAVEDEGQNGDMAPMPEEGEEIREAPPSQENGAADKRASGNDESSDSDSDTDEEEDEKLVMKALPTSPQKLSSPDHAGDLPKPPSPSKTSGALSPESRVLPPLNTTEEIKCESRLGVTSGPPAQASSPGNERRIAVSSPGRGHKIFVVTRVESLPEKAVPEGADTRQEGSPLPPRASPPKPSDPPVPQAQPAKTECSDGQATEAVPKRAAGSETSPSTPSPVLGAEKMNSGPCESGVHSSLLPNGLRMEFVHALPDAPSGHDGKMDSCSVEHVLGHSASNGVSLGKRLPSFTSTLHHVILKTTTPPP